MEHKPGQWYQRDPFRDDDTGDVGGDVQVGPAHSVSWQRRLFTDQYETLTVYYFAASVPPGPPTYVQCMVELIRHRDNDDPGGTEIDSDYRYLDLHVLVGVDAAIMARSMCDAAELSGEPGGIRGEYPKD